jgi:hypothetical protein
LSAISVMPSNRCIRFWSDSSHTCSSGDTAIAGGSVYPLKLKDSAWAVPEAPGLGIEIDEVAAARHPFKQEVIPATDSVLADGRVANW